MRLKHNVPYLGATLVASLLAACSSGGSSSTIPGSGSDLNVISVSVVDGAIWKINRPIEVVFDQPVDFSTVNMNTIQILNGSGVSATGVFSQPLSVAGNVQEHIVRFQPNCPSEDDFSDSGLQVNSSYQLRVLGANDSPSEISVQSTSGGALQVSQVVNFTTPNSTLPSTLFLDTVPGPPAVRIRGLAGLSTTETLASYLELGGDPSNRLYFNDNGVPGLGTFELPLNKYSDSDTQFAVLLYLNQPVLASSDNINSEQVSFEYEQTANVWESVSTVVTLEENCVGSGSILRLEPQGLIPQGSQIRVAVRQGFVDLIGDPTTQDTNNFAMMNSTTAVGGVDSDELLEEFVLSGNHPASIEDRETPLGDPRALWADGGQLNASFAFGGTGGPGGDFDYHVPAGQTITISTTTASISGGPNGAPVAAQTVINGVMDVRNLVVPAGSRLIFVGPNPATILASGTVTVEGSISVNGGNNDGVGTLNTTFQPEPGAAGNAGGGKGGRASFLTASSTPRGGAGEGAFSTAGRGGGGGETGYSNNSTIDDRRAAGGGGGTLGADIYYDHDDDNATADVRCQTLVGMDGERGFGGSAQGTGAVSQSVRAQGGIRGPSPFSDSLETNNFLGTQINSAGVLISGELESIWAGAGGGAGGDASRTAQFPQVPFQTGGDEKGSGGGGGAGGLTILAIGPIVIEEAGEIQAIGGHGGGGENTLYFDRIGGGGGGGSGGHIVLSSADSVQINGESPSAGDEYRDPVAGHRLRPISALGGQGGAGHENHGGASEDGPTSWRCDAIRLEYVTGVGGAPDVPPLAGASSCFGTIGMDDFLDLEEGPVLAAGGDGGPGIIQMHVDDPGTNLRFSDASGGMTQTWTNADITKWTVPPAEGWNGPGQPTDDFVAFFGRISLAQSEWIPLGLARVAPGGGTDQVTFFFDGTTPATGSVERSGAGSGAAAIDLPFVIAAADVDNPVGSVPFVDNGGVSLVMDSSGLDAAYLANASMLKGFSIVLEDSVATQSFLVTSAEHLPGNQVRVSVAADDNLLDNFINTSTGQVTAALRPHFYRLVTEDQLDAFPTGTDVQILFDAAVNGPDGLPDPSSTFSSGNGGDLTGDITNLNSANWDYVRFRVIFNLNTGLGGVDPTAPRPGLEYLRIPFTY